MSELELVCLAKIAERQSLTKVVRDGHTLKSDLMWWAARFSMQTWDPQCPRRTRHLFLW